MCMSIRKGPSLSFVPLDVLHCGLVAEHEQKFDKTVILKKKNIVADLVSDQETNQVEPLKQRGHDQY